MVREKTGNSVSGQGGFYVNGAASFDECFSLITTILLSMVNKIKANFQHKLPPFI